MARQGAQAPHDHSQTLSSPASTVKERTPGYSQQSINEWILKKYGQQDPHNLTRAQYDEACAAMDNAKQQGGQDNA